MLELREIDRPFPKDDEALVRIHAAALNGADFEMMRGTWSVRQLFSDSISFVYVVRWILSETWWIDSNEYRPHGLLGNRTPKEFALLGRNTGDRITLDSIT